jgi:NADPH-dependent 2,4-dienoyl-CoA reductase/sulfur reductase-like enzyme
LNDLPRWQVKRENGRIFVGKKLAAVQREVRARTGSSQSFLIVGAGAAGNSAAETLRREGFEGRISVVDPEPDAPYDRPNLSKDYLAGTAPEEWIPLHPRSYYDDLGIELLTGRGAKTLDVGARRVLLDGGTACDFDQLLIATGASPVVLNLDIEHNRRVHYLRSLADSRQIIQAAKGSRHAVVLGTSFIGLEVAASLRARGLEVHAVGPDTVPLGRILGPELGRFVHDLHQEHGVVFHLGHTARTWDGQWVTLDDGTRIPADMVVAGVGVRPNVELAVQAGLAVDAGILVDQRLETSAPGVFAAGDVAHWIDPRSGDRVRVEHWVVAERMGQTAARNMIGAHEPFDAVPFFWSQHYDVPIAYVGHATRWDRVTVEGSPASRDCAVTYYLGDRVLATATIYRDRESLETELAMERTIGAVTQ